MRTAAATRTRSTHAAPIGAGELHNALETSRDLHRLHGFCAVHRCAEEAVSVDGTRLDMPRVFALMRSRGYLVSDPETPQTQRKFGMITLLVQITLPAGPSFKLAYYEPIARK